jgi:thiamine pyrophosphate-dependent acetolactate synthase large subunit-like protein
MLCEPDVAVPMLLEAVRARPAAVSSRQELASNTEAKLSIRALADTFNEVTSGMEICLSKLPLGWNGAYRHFRHPLDYLGADGGGGVGAGPGLTVGAALALKGNRRMVVGICGDGDFLMGVTAVWTAAHYKLPCLFIVANNRSFYNDEMHQERVAKERGRPIENKWIGQRIDEPDIDLAMMARAQGAIGLGPVKDASHLKDVLKEAIKQVKAGNVCVVDVRVLPGYDTNMGGTPPARR